MYFNKTQNIIINFEFEFFGFLILRSLLYTLFDENVL